MHTLKTKLPPIGQLGPFIALVIACAFFGVTTERFFSGENFSLILQQVMVVGVIAIGQTLIILTAGIDLSCGMVMALGSIVMTKFAADLGLPAPLAILCGIARDGAASVCSTACWSRASSCRRSSSRSAPSTSPSRSPSSTRARRRSPTCRR